MSEKLGIKIKLIIIFSKNNSYQETTDQLSET